MKRMNYYIVCGLLLAGFGFASCDDFLEVKPEDARTSEYFYKTPKETQQALMGIYNGLMPVSTYNLLLSDVRSDDTWLGISSESEANYQALSNYRKYISSLAVLESAWTDYYEIIARANMFLEKIEDVTFPENEFNVNVKETFISEARFLRAFAYFDLVRYFGRVPMVTKTQSVSEASTTPQSEAKDIYEQVIIPDLQYAVEHMDSVAYNYAGEESAVGRANKIAAEALLGRVYWTMSGFPLNDASKIEPAKEQLKAVLDYAGAFGAAPTRYWAKDRKEWMHIWISDNDNKYHIFEIQYAMKSDYGNPMVYTSLPKVSKSLTHLTMSGSSINATQSLRNLYNENPADYTRYRHTIRYSTSSTSRYFEKFFENIPKRDSLGYAGIDDQIIDRKSFPINYPLIRLEDVMLMYAYLSGPTPEGIALVNKIRTRAGISALPSTMAEDNYLKAVMDERRRELAGEGIRWHDIVRTGHFEDYIKAAYSQEGGSAASIISNVQPGMYLYPIPNNQMLVRQGLYEQNEAYK